MPCCAPFSPQSASCLSRFSRILSLVTVSLLWPLIGGCSVNVKGIMYLHKERVTRYIDEKKPTGKSALVKENYQEVLKSVPDGDRILGGFCTNNEIAQEIKLLRDLTQQCHRKLQQYQKEGTHNGNVYVGLLGGTIGAGLLTITAGVLGAVGAFGQPNSANIGGWMVLGFGVPTLALSLANSIGGFNYRYREFKRQAIRLDNMMWTMRLRLGVEVCNARTVDRARVKVGNIRRMMEMTCAENFNDDGTYRPR